jgi:hypothetical protein
MSTPGTWNGHERFGLCFRGSTYKLVYGSESRETGLLQCARINQCQNIQEYTSLTTKRTRNCLANSGILVTTSMLCVSS